MHQRIQHVRNIRDLLVATLAPDLTRFILAEVEPDSDAAAEQVVAFVLDHITALSFEKLAEWRAGIEVAQAPANEQPQEGGT